MHLWLIRHGHTSSESAPGVFTPDGVLSPLGKAQATRTARRLASERVTHVVTSPLVRALATASTIAEATAGLPVHVWTELREGYGDMPGQPVATYHGPGRADLLRRFPRALLPSSITEEGWVHGGDNAYEPFFSRCEDLARKLHAQFGTEDRVVVVGHGGCLNYLLHVLLGIPSPRPAWFHMDHCAISTLRLIPDEERQRGWPLYPGVNVEVWGLNDVGHLAPTERSR